jgi:hypothetical protein
MKHEVYLVCSGNAASESYDETLDIVHSFTFYYCESTFGIIHAFNF